MQKYRPNQGETWESVSYKLYGSSDFAKNLIDLNPEMRFIEYFDGGNVIQYEKITASQESSVNLPPWR